MRDDQRQALQDIATLIKVAADTIERAGDQANLFGCNTPELPIYNVRLALGSAELALEDAGAELAKTLQE